MHDSHPNAVQRLTRAGLHKLQFAAAYVVILLVIYYNEQIIVGILVGALVGARLFKEDMGGWGKGGFFSRFLEL